MVDTDSLRETLEIMKRKYSQDIGIVQKLQEDKKNKEEEIESLSKDKDTLDIQKILLQDASVEARKNAKDVLQTMATRALQFIMGDYMSLEIKLDEKGSAPVAEFIVKSKYSDYTVEADPADEEGGGIADIVSHACLIALLELTGENNVAPIFLDEPSKYVSKGNSENVARFFYEISSAINRQVIMSTHDEYLAKTGDKAFHFRINEGKTEITVLSA
ncbi:hypothetical protein PP175_27065 (plasmid) [Aneurinibacillus sp. Ricciae_BoGa-3]|uniref:hypothetical protein n=1 Tax=Aneurinibacillus sp. Ricciae_BoGa-3 TaxID=3022697 RepID=UPI0023412499|nr:hypothetical protein [Aneurinibacillus sp. Ricciae_BoGa-3]WCK57700.1 hypothetical protein PP175_27065 [Aneurinibacillus sp. Ricciae_BoGa-3]